MPNNYRIYYQQIAKKRQVSRCRLILLLMLQLLVCPWCIMPATHAAAASAYIRSSDVEKIPELLQERKFRQALPLLEQLLELHPHDASFHYAMGVCLVELDTLHEHALYHLNRAKSQSYAADIDYYLGKSYYYHYAFSEAYTAFTQYQQNAGWRRLRETNHEAYLRSSQHANDLLKQTQVYELVEERDIPYYEITDYYNMLRNRSLVDTDPSSGPDFLYYVRSTRQSGQDIFRMRNTQSSFSGGEALSSLINTKEDESYPYFDKKSQTLYFSSKGHAGMGSFDVFRATLNPQTNTWSKPENLGFPANSPYNDYFFIPQEDGTYILASDRKGIPETITLFTLRKTAHHINALDFDLRRRGELASFIFKEELKEAEVLDLQAAIERRQTAPGDSILLIALQNQLRIDSLQRLAHTKEEAFYQSFNTSERSSLRTEIAHLNTQAKRLSESNKLLYAKVPESSTAYLLQNRTSKQSGELLNDFEIRQASIYSANKPYPRDIALPEGIVYRIQLGAFGNNISYSRFQGLTPITVETIENSNISRYYVGMFQSYRACTEALKKVKRMGYTDAYVVSFLNGNRITLQRALEIEEYTKGGE